MNIQRTLQTIQWLKRITAVIAIGVWIYVIGTFLHASSPFSELMPYCMGSTMLIFGILTGIFKGLEYWEKRIVDNG